MASRDPRSLALGMQVKLQAFQQLVDSPLFAIGESVSVYCCWRGPREQAKLFRKTRRLREIERKGVELADAGFPELALILDQVGPQPGPLGDHVTHAGPGESWHQWGQAFDCVPVRNQEAVWDKRDRFWGTLQAIAFQVQLDWGGLWKFEDYPHFQAPGLADNPLIEPDIRNYWHFIERAEPDQ